MSLRSEVIALLEQVENTPSESLESDTIEFKEFTGEDAFYNSKDLAGEISALANHLGGVIIVGVRDSGNIANSDWASQLVGFPQIDLHSAFERINGKIQPALRLRLDEVGYQSKSFLAIEVPCKRDTLVATRSGKVCIRDGKSSRPMTIYEIETAVKHLQDYDWSSESLELDPSTALDESAVKEALLDFARRRNISDLPVSDFLEAVGVTRNGKLSKGGLLFLGKPDMIRGNLGRYEYRFSHKLKNGELVINDVWSSSIWTSIGRAKSHFNACNQTNIMEHEGNKYDVQTLDEIAFREAYLNALVHRDYAIDGMISVDFTGDEISITSPGTFYGGVSAENIARHEPRHRNKALAGILMQYHLVDRAGMGVVRMGVNSLRYGRSFPHFSEIGDSVQVSMQTEFIRAGIFVIVTSNPKKFGIPELLIMNNLYEVGYTKVDDMVKQLLKVTDKPLQAIITADKEIDCVELCGNTEGIYMRVTPAYNKFFNVTRTFRTTGTSSKHVMLYLYLKRHGNASNADIKQLLAFKHTSQTSAFLSHAKYLHRRGNGPSSRWHVIV